MSEDRSEDVKMDAMKEFGSLEVNRDIQWTNKACIDFEILFLKCGHYLYII